MAQNPEQFRGGNFKPHRPEMVEPDTTIRYENPNSSEWLSLDNYSLRARLRRDHGIPPIETHFVRVAAFSKSKGFLTITSPEGGTVSYPTTVIEAVSIRGRDLVVFWETPNDEVISTPHHNARILTGDGKSS